MRVKPRNIFSKITSGLTLGVIALSVFAVGSFAALGVLQKSTELRSQAGSFSCGYKGANYTCIPNKDCPDGWACQANENTGGGGGDKTGNWCGADAAGTSYKSPCSPDGVVNCGGDGKETKCEGGVWKATGVCCTGEGGKGGAPVSCGQLSQANCTGECSWFAQCGKCDAKNKLESVVCPVETVPPGGGGGGIKTIPNCSDFKTGAKEGATGAIACKKSDGTVGYMCPNNTGYAKPENSCVTPPQCEAGKSWYGCANGCYPTGGQAYQYCQCQYLEMSECAIAQANQACTYDKETSTCVIRGYGSCTGLNDCTPALANEGQTKCIANSITKYCCPSGEKARGGKCLPQEIADLNECTSLNSCADYKPKGNVSPVCYSTQLHKMMYCCASGTSLKSGECVSTAPKDPPSAIECGKARNDGACNDIPGCTPFTNCAGTGFGGCFPDGTKFAETCSCHTRSQTTCGIDGGCKFVDGQCLSLTEATEKSTAQAIVNWMKDALEKVKSLPGWLRSNTLSQPTPSK